MNDEETKELVEGLESAGLNVIRFDESMPEFSKPYRFIEDPGHGWLEVKREELEELGIADKISSCSYQSNNGMVYLEEDCDAWTFAQAKQWGRGFFPAKIIYQENTFVRNLPHYEQS